MAHRAPSSSITLKWTYDAFLSFHGQDTRSGFISHLYHSLHQSGIRSFLDDEFIRTGETLTPALSKAIEESRIAIIVFSENYANSTFCLEQLVKILEFFKKESRLIFPVFYDVDPSELRHPKGSYAEALARLEERFKDERHKVEKWRLALSQVSELKGYHLKPKIVKEQECITGIVNEVAARINYQPLYVTNYPVGLVSRVKEVISHLDLWSTKETKMIGIWGAGGIGKSTVARAVYNSIADHFEGLCFLSGVSQQSKKPNGLLDLQEILLRKLVKEKYLKLGDYHEGISIIKDRLSHKKILLILDDVDESDQLEALAGSCDWFGHGSRIIITTRKKQLLVSHDVKSIYDVKELNDEESLELLSWHAFGKENVDSNYMMVCYGAIQNLQGVPLYLAVIGSTLRGKGVEHWMITLEELKTKPHERVLGALKLSDDTIREEHVETFDDGQNYDVANPISSTFNAHLWEKKERIGAGGFGIVHVGLNIKTGESCAIKEILDIDDLQTAQSLHQEIQILSQLQHKNIVKYYGSDIVSSQISIYMEYVQPGSLGKYIRSQVKDQVALPESLVRDFAAQILSGLVYLHSQRVVHRDIKPDNLLVDSKNGVKLADFGLAKHVAKSVGKHSVRGTPYYASPECLLEEAYKSLDEASAADIWGLGCVVIEMITGQHPWPNCSGLQAYGKVCYEKKDPTIPKNLSSSGKDFLKSCFARNLDKRPSAAELLEHPFITTQT